MSAPSPALTFHPSAAYATQFDLCERFMASFAASVKDMVAADVYKSIWVAAENAKGSAIFETRRTVEAIRAMAAADREAAEEALDAPEPPQTAEELGQLAYQQTLAVRRYEPGGREILGALRAASTTATR